jgi:hypothetical protein
MPVESRRIRKSTKPIHGNYVDGNRNLPHECLYCARTFKNLGTAQKLHPMCTMWSCSFLPGLQYTMYPTGSPRKREAVCCYCNDLLAQSADGKVNGALLKEHMAQHNFRTCNQMLYFSGQRFRQHLHDSHRTSYDSTLFGGWTLLLKSSRRKTPSLFQQVEVKAVGRPSISDPSWMVADSNEDKKKKKKSKKTKHDDKIGDNAVNTPTNFMEWTEIPQRVEPNKLRRKQSAVVIPDTAEGTPRPSFQCFSPRSATANDVAMPNEQLPTSLKPKSEKCIVYPSASGAPDVPNFYRRRLDASNRNRIYIDADEEPVSGDAKQVFMRMEGSVLGGLVLHTSLIAAVPALMTNCVDIYSLG